MTTMADLHHFVSTHKGFSEAYRKKVLGSISLCTRLPHYEGRSLAQIPCDKSTFDPSWGKGPVRGLPKGFKSKSSFSTWRSQMRSALKALHGDPPPVAHISCEDDWTVLATDLRVQGVDPRKLIAVKVMVDLARIDALQPEHVTRPWLQSQVDQATTSGRYRCLQSAFKLIKAHKASGNVTLSDAFDGPPLLKSRKHCVRAPFPEPLGTEVRTWYDNRLEGERIGHRQKRKSACSPGRAKQALNGVSYIWTAMLHTGQIELTKPVSVVDLANPDLLEDVILRELEGQFLWEKLAPTTLYEYISNWKFFVKGAGEDSGPLTELVRDFEAFEDIKSMSPARREWCDSFLRSAHQKRAFLALPASLFKAAKKRMEHYETGSEFDKDAGIALSIAACAAAIWTSLPLRISTLLQLRFGGADPDIQIHDKRNGLVLTTPPSIVKNGYSHRYIHLTAKPGGDPREIVQWFVTNIRPLLLDHHITADRCDRARLFGGISYGRLNTIWQNATLEQGVPMTPHQVRHALATLLANEPNADFSIIAALLGDTEATVRKNYSFIDKAQKHAHGQDLLVKLQGHILRRGMA